MLRAVVHKGALNIGHKRGERKVSDKYSHLDKTLNNSGEPGRHSPNLYGIKNKIYARGYPNRKEEEKHHRKPKTENKRNYHYKVGKAYMKLFRKPFFEF